MTTLKKTIALIAAASIMLTSACTIVGESELPAIRPSKISEKFPIDSEITEQVSSKTQQESITEAFDTVEPESEAPAETEPKEETFEYINYDPDYKDRLNGYFTDEQIDYIRSCVFVGDSTCLAFTYYGFISPERCYAKAGAAARNIFDWEFTQRKEEADILTALKNSGCKNFYFLMGLNDVNMTSADDYYKNYKEFLDKVSEVCPYANINILSVTPVTEKCEFCYNSSLNRLNKKLVLISEESSGKIKYIDIASSFKTENGAMKPAYVTSDGIHIREGGYYDILRIICEKAGV